MTAAGTLVTGLAPNGLAAGAMQAVAGVGNGAENIAAQTLIQQVVPREMLGRVFGLFGTAAFIGSSLAYLLAGVLLDATSPRITFIVGGSGALLVVIALTPFMWRARTPQPNP